MIDIVTLFPDMFAGPFDQSILRRASDKLLVSINLHDLRDFAVDKRGTVDDRPYGGGVGMVMRIEPIYRALEQIKDHRVNSLTVLTDPRGNKFTQSKARFFSGLEQFIIICGHYEGIDERVREHLVDESISIGDYVLTGGEIPAMVITDAVVRLVPGVLEKKEATANESFSFNTTGQGNNQFEYPQYTRPEEFMGWKVPEILLSGNHGAIEKWRKERISR